MNLLMRTLRGRMRRRLLLTYRVDPSAAGEMIPAPFRPQLIDGSAVGGVCLIALTELRPGWLRPRWGISTENAAHRFAVEWDESGTTRTGVYVIERHSSDIVPVIGGGRFFPGVQRRARFDIDETDSRIQVRMQASDASVSADIEVSEEWESSLFPTVGDASRFYRAGATGWSPRRDGRGAEAVELSAARWAVEAGRVNEVRSSFFDGLPQGAAQIDSVLVMRDLPVSWRRPATTRP
ncbi:MULTISPECIES: DUF2071 domain-containing protein [unclassified Microbacterium]|uniref:DUF2071 domain-containing protein n=1 Tax=unclassified Microbacterium TaxID=2609290 RepID=UPI0009DD3DB9|nr:MULTISPECIES: DUF2071 domain-containing protein [unclassified Microbacterium]